MQTYIILSQLSPDAIGDPKEYRQLATAVKEKLHSECPDVQWRDSYATAGRFNVVDVIESDNPTQVKKAAMIIGAEGHSSTETMLATPWKEFMASL